MSVFYNFTSLLLGLAAWTLGIVAIAARQPGKIQRLSFGSMSACTIALLLQIFEVLNRFSIHDIDAVTDTIGGIAFVSGTLTVITIAINLVALIKAGKKK